MTIDLEKHGLRVTPLEWVFWTAGLIAGADARSPFGLYQIRSQPQANIHRLFLGVRQIAEGDYTDLKPAAQADYEARILAALSAHEAKEADNG